METTIYLSGCRCAGGLCCAGHPSSLVSQGRAGACWREGCMTPPSMAEGDGYGPDHLTCEPHSLARSPAALPMGYHARTLGFPLAAPYTSAVVTSPGMMVVG